MAPIFGGIYHLTALISIKLSGISGKYKGSGRYLLEASCLQSERVLRPKGQGKEEAHDTF